MALSWEFLGFWRGHGARRLKKNRRGRGGGDFIFSLLSNSRIHGKARLVKYIGVESVRNDKTSS